MTDTDNEREALLETRIAELNEDMLYAFKESNKLRAEINKLQSERLGVREELNRALFENGNLRVEVSRLQLEASEARPLSLGSMKAEQLESYLKEVVSRFNDEDDDAIDHDYIVSLVKRTVSHAAIMDQGDFEEYVSGLAKAEHAKADVRIVNDFLEKHLAAAVEAEVKTAVADALKSNLFVNLEATIIASLEDEINDRCNRFIGDTDWSVELEDAIDSSVSLAIEHRKKKFISLLGDLDV